MSVVCAPRQPTMSTDNDGPCGAALNEPSLTLSQYLYYADTKSLWTWLTSPPRYASVWCAVIFVCKCTASKCILTIISCGVHYSLLASRLACLRDLMSLKLAQRTPIVRLTVTAASDQQPKQQKQQQQQQQKQASASIMQYDSATATTPTSESADKDRDVSLLQRFKRIIDEKRESYEQERRRKLQQGSAEVSSGSMAEVILGLLTSSNPATATVDASLSTTSVSTTTSTTTTTTTTTTTATAVSRSNPSATVEDDITQASTATSTAADLRRRKTTDSKTSTDAITLRRSQSAELTNMTRDNDQEKTTAHKSTMTSIPGQPSASDIGAYRLINVICKYSPYKFRIIVEFAG